jgi:D-sedoheptulose 7-phosphate isomerase
MNKEKISKIIDEISKNFAELSNSCNDDISTASELIIQSIQSGGKVMFCGNGGSAADSQHLAAELIGRYRKDRKALPGLALTTDTSNITAVANDYAYKQIFSRQIEGLGKENDVLYAISTSGKSENIIEAINVAKKLKIKTIGVTGKDGGDMSNICDIVIKAPASMPDRIQELHIAIGQIICGIVEETLC